MKKSEFLDRMMIEASQHWNYLKDIHEDDADFPPPESCTFEQLLATFVDLRAEFYRSQALEQDAKNRAAKARLANPYR